MGVILKQKTLLLILAIFLSGCSPASPSPTIAPASEIASPAGTSTSAPELVTRLRNGQYQLGATDTFRVVQLTDGKYEQGSPGDTDYFSVTVTDLVAVGDLNNDGVNDAAALIAENYGGTGVFAFLAVYLEMGGSLNYQASSYVDDRPGLKALSITNGEIYLDTLIHKNDDPFCCPSYRVTRHYRLAGNNQLGITDLVTFTPSEKPRIITIDAPVNGQEVTSSVQIKGNVTVAPFENNLVYRIFDGGGVELASGPIAVTAAEAGGPGTFDTVISLGSLLSGTIVYLEIQDVSAEDGSLFAMDSAELVVK
jgi:hypothetical protein